MTSSRASVVGSVVGGLAVVVACGIADGAAASPGAPPQVVPVAAAAAGPQARAVQAGQRRPYRATRTIVVDRQSRQPRLPTQVELEALVATLATLTHRPETAPEHAAARGAVTAGLSAGFGGVVLARANEDGSVETRCVFTFEEGAEFLGLIEVLQ